MPEFDNDIDLSVFTGRFLMIQRENLGNKFECFLVKLIYIASHKIMVTS